MFTPASLFSPRNSQPQHCWHLMSEFFVGRAVLQDTRWSPLPLPTRWRSILSQYYHKRTTLPSVPWDQRSKTPPAEATRLSQQDQGSQPGKLVILVNRLPFKDLMCVLRSVTQPCLDSGWPHGLQPARLLCPWDFPGKNIGVPFPLPGDLPDPGIKSTSPASPALAGRSFTTESPVKWRRQWHPTPVLLPGQSHGRRSLVGCSPWGR